MPGGDGTGPFGFGPKTGRAAGFCWSGAAPDPADPVLERARLMGREDSPWLYHNMVRDEKSILEQQAKFLREELRLVEERLNDLRESEEKN